MTVPSAVLARADSAFPLALERLRAFARIPSVSSDSTRAGDVRRAAEWVRDQLREIGFRADLRETGGHPAVIAKHDGPGSGPRVLFYGHYDVQPVDPIELWNSPPFEPALVEAENGPRLVGRGVSDDKGQLMSFIEACRAWVEETGSLPVAVALLLEGEEESGSAHLEALLRDAADELRADICVVCDTNGLAPDTPAITTRLRGLVYEEITVRGPSRDLHSGLFGGIALNPLNELVRMLAALRDGEGRATVPGFYDGIIPPSDEERAVWASLPIREEETLGAIGLFTPWGGERGLPMLERLWARPTLDLNGLKGGHGGEGSKTVIAAEAVAKLSCRLVPGQDPERIVISLRRFLTELAPPDLKIEFRSFGAAPAYRLDPASPFLRAAREAIDSVSPKACALVGGGASIPIAHHIRTILGVECLLIGFGLDDDRIHSPNEKFDTRCFANGIRSHVAALRKFATVGA